LVKILFAVIVALLLACLTAPKSQMAVRHRPPMSRYETRRRFSWLIWQEGCRTPNGAAYRKLRLAGYR
jgi:hypothetical protein